MTAYVDADLREPEKILTDPGLLTTIDLGRPVALMLIAALHFIEEQDDPYGVVRRLAGALAPGSYLAVSHATSDYLPAELVADIAAGKHGRGRLRSRAQFARFFTGFELVEPAVVPLSDWRPAGEPGPRPCAEETGMYAGVARIG